MSSTYVPQPNEYWIHNPLNPENPHQVMSYVQFVPGIVVSTVTGGDSLKYANSDRKINSIIALPHYSSDGIKKQSTAGEEFRYYPLFRGVQETPVAGDPVLLCKFGGIKYYLGPINTEGKPNFNKDQFDNTEIPSGYETGAKNTGTNTNPLFVKTAVNRLEKRLNPKLDNPIDWTEDSKIISTVIPGDMLFEGRYGNSIRIGSRHTNPYLIISNGRNPLNNIESSLDGTIFSMFNNGSIRDHFNNDYSSVGVSTEEGIKIYPFTLADDEAQENNKEKPDLKRHIAKSFDNYLGRGGVSAKETTFSVEEEIYNYSKDQLFASSGRITFNARSDSIFLSAFKHIHIGCGSSMTFSTSRNILIEAAESVITNTPLFHVNAAGAVYIDGRMTEDVDGNKIPAISLGNPDKGDSMHKAVLGDGLVTTLVFILEEMKNLALATSEAVEGHKAVGASIEIMTRIVKSIDDILGKELVDDEVREESYEYPRTLADLILSDSVEIKK